MASAFVIIEIVKDMLAFSPRHKLIIYMVTICITSFGQINADLYLPSVIAIAHSLKTSVDYIQLSLAIYIFGFGVSQLIYGPLSDGIGRRVPLLIGTSVAAIGSVICLMAHSVEALWLGRLLQGIGAGAGEALLRPMLIDLFDEYTIVRYAAYSAVISVGMLAGAPLLGGVLQELFGWQANFLFLTIYATVIFLAVLMIIPETNIHRERANLRITTIKQNFLFVMRNNIFLAFSSCSLFTYAALIVWLTIGPVLLQKQLGLSPVDFGWVYLILGLMFIAGAQTNARLANRLGFTNMLLKGLLLLAIAGVAMLLLRIIGLVNVYVIVLPMMLVMFAASIIFPNTFVGAFQQVKQKAGMAGSLFGSMRILGGAIAGGIAAWLPDSSQTAIAVALMLLATVAWWCFKKLIPVDR